MTLFNTYFLKVILLSLFFIQTAAAQYSKNTSTQLGENAFITTLNEQEIKKLTYSPDGNRIIYLKAQKENAAIFDLWQYSVNTHENIRLITAEKLSTFVDENNVAFTRTLNSISDIGFISDGLAISFLSSGDIFSYATKSKELTQFTQTKTQEHTLTVSPSTDRITFIRNDNIFYIEVHSGEERQLTKRTKKVKSSGIGNITSAQFIKRSANFWWSPNEDHIAYIQTLHTKKTTDHLATSLILQNLKTGKLKALTTIKSQNYILDVKWLADGGEVSYVWLDKKQKQIGLNAYAVKSDTQTNLIFEESNFWLNTGQDWLFTPNNNGVIWSSERDGYKHLYHYAGNGKPALQITQGDWSVDELIALDEKNGWVYFTGRSDSPLERHLYKVPLSGKSPNNIVKISQNAGFNQVVFSPSLSTYINQHSSITSSNRVSLHSINGDNIGSISLDSSPKLNNLNNSFKSNTLPHVSFGTLFADNDNTPLFYKMSKPKEMTVGKKYPVVVLLPNSPFQQRVKNQWQTHSFPAYLVSQGFIVFELDSRGSQHRGTAFQFPLYQDIGNEDVSDQLTGVHFLRSLPYVDKMNISLHGQRYGGYLALALLSSAQNNVLIQEAPDTRFDSALTSQEQKTSVTRLPEENLVNTNINDNVDSKNSTEKKSPHLFNRASIGNAIYDWSTHHLFLKQKWYASSLLSNQGASGKPKIKIEDIHAKLFIFYSKQEDVVDIQQFRALTADLETAEKTFVVSESLTVKTPLQDSELQKSLFPTIAAFFKTPLEKLAPIIAQ